MSKRHIQVTRTCTSNSKCDSETSTSVAAASASGTKTVFVSVTRNDEMIISVENENSKEDEFKFALIKLVEENKCLYDKTYAYYQTKTNRDSAWCTIAEELGTTVTECRIAWKALRDLYYKKAKKEFQNAPSGGTLEDWQFSKPLKFLKNNIDFFSRSPSRNNKRKNEKFIVLKSTQRNRPRQECFSPELKIVEIDVDENTKEDYSEDSTDVPKDSGMKDEYLEEFLEEDVAETSFNSEDTEDDEEKVFLKSILRMLKILSPDVKDQFKSKIYTEIFKLRKEARKNNLKNS